MNAREDGKREAGRVTYRPAALSDAELLAPRLRLSDQREIEALSEEPFVEILTHGVLNSDPCVTAVVAGEPVALFGVVRDRKGVGRVWMLGSPFIDEHPIMCYREASVWVERFLTQYELLWNYAAPLNSRRLAWLGRCGFEIVQREVEFGPKNHKCVLFMRGRSKTIA